MRTFIKYSLLLVILIGVSSCSKFRRIQKSPDWRLKYDAAVNYYEEGIELLDVRPRRASKRFYRANTLLDEILPIIRGTAEAELGNFYFAYSYFHMGQYILSAHQFQEFMRIYGRSEYVMEAEYMRAISIYLQSPEYNLDQTSTYEAIDALQAYLDHYPAAEEFEIADSLINDLQVKLETKAYHNAVLFHKIRKYKAALVIFDNFYNDFPDSEFREEIEYLEIETSYDYAKVSFTDKQEERFRNCIEKYEQFLEKYPNSEYLEDAEELFTKSREELAKFARRNNNDNS